MNVRALSAAVIAATALVSSAGIASAQQAGPADAAFAAQLNEAANAARNNVPAGIGRDEMLIVNRYLKIAEDFYNQGQTARAQSYLNFARGELGLRNSSTAVAGNAQTAAR
jgi:hypothetical protein